jgi:CheY-like chemotaxis protein
VLIAPTSSSLSIRSVTIVESGTRIPWQRRAVSARDVLRGTHVAKILVVDDVEDIVFMMSSVLETFGHELRIASNGLEAFDVAAAFLPEIVFMDLDMPVLNGLDAARLIKSRLPFKPYLVAVTGNAIDGLHATARAAGFDLCVRKPAGIGVLLAIIDGVAPEGA